MNKLTLFLADDHHIVRQGLIKLLETEPDIDIIGDSDNGQQTIQMVKQFQPDILVVDLMMPGINGIEVTRQVSKLSQKTRTVILSMYGNESYVIEAFKAGAKAYVLKESTADELVVAIHHAASNHRYLSQALSEKAIEAYIRKEKDVKLDPYETLTMREREIFNMVIQDFTNIQIASQLCLSRRTVEVHRRNLMHKLGIHSQRELLNFAMQRGMIPSGPAPQEEKK
jgi:two-component system response regulator NreC